MRLSQLFPKTKKVPSKDATTANHRLLTQGGFIDQLMAGSWTLLPLGWRVIQKINQIIREEMNATGAQEMLMPLMHPREIWSETGRWETASEVMYKLKDSRGKEFALSFTHEEIVLDLIRKHVQSYADLPLKLYHFSTKFRNEPRPTGGILRGREFLMKDLYSLHISEEDLMKYYQEVWDAYLRIFERLGLEVIVTEASGGVFTERRTHEFQVLAEAGEDTIFYCPACRFGYNKEIFAGKAGDLCQKCHEEKLVEGSSIEVGNIFPLGTWYSERMDGYVTGQAGERKVIWFGSYGIGCSRCLGALVEAYHDEKGIIWPESVAPYQVQLISLSARQLVKKTSDETYQKLSAAGLAVLYDDRENVSPGEKFADADLIGCPYRVVVSEKTLEQDSVEVKKRNTPEVALVSQKEIVNYLRALR